MKKIVIIHIAFLLAISLSAQSVKELQKQQRELQQQLEQTSHMLKQTKQSETATVNKLNLLNSDIKTRKKLIQNIQLLSPPGRQKPEYPAAHFRFAVLMLSRMIPAAATETADAKTVVFHDMAIDTVAALRGIALIAAIMISMDVKHRASGHGYKKAQIIRLQIAAGDDQLDPIQPFGQKVIP